jgi:hypothetical protein
MQVGEQMSERIRIQRRKQISDSYSYPQLATDTRGLRMGTTLGSVDHDISRISLRPQARLTVSQPGDFYEQEADRVAQQVMGMGDRANNNAVQREASPQEEEENLQLKSLGNTITPLVQREEIPEEEEEEEILQMKSLGNLAIQREEIPEEEEEEEILQMKSLGNLAIQREEIPEEEEEEEEEILQMKSLGNFAIQREEIPEEEEEEEEEILQMKSLGNLAIQREEIPEEEEEEEELVQAKSSLQRFDDGGLAASTDISSKLHSRKGQGNPLANDVRNFMESRFGVDFSNVKVHTDGEAVQMSRELGAQAFTYGSDIYFGTGKSPGNNELTAHELTHVVQQTDGMKRKCTACEEEEELMGKEDSATHHSPRKLSTIQRQTASPNANVNIAPSDPNRKLTWDDFKGVPKLSGNTAAETSYTFVRKRIQGTVQFQAKFLFHKSWVLPKYKNPSNRSLNGCSKPVSDCKNFLKQNPNGTYGFEGQSDPECKNAIVPSAVQVKSKGDCESVLGSACDAALKKDSEERLLKHERTHFDIATALAAKANEKIKGGADPNDVEKELGKESKKLQKTYDSETHHGCIASYQAAWDAGIY